MPYKFNPFTGNLDFYEKGGGGGGITLLEVEEKLATLKLAAGVAVTGAFKVAGELKQEGAAVFSKTVKIAEELKAEGAIVASKTLKVAEELKAEGAAVFSKTIKVAEESKLEGAVVASKTLKVGEGSTLEGAVTASKTLKVTEESKLEGTTTMGAAATVAKTLKVKEELTAEAAATVEKALTAKGEVLLEPESPAEITATPQNNYEVKKVIERLAANKAVEITGLKSATTGRVVTLINVGTNTITLVNESASSEEANRFQFSTATNCVFEPKQAITVAWDGTTKRWRDLAQVPSSFASTVAGATTAEETEIKNAFEKVPLKKAIKDPGGNLSTEGFYKAPATGYYFCSAGVGAHVPAKGVLFANVAVNGTRKINGPQALAGAAEELLATTTSGITFVESGQKIELVAFDTEKKKILTGELNTFLWVVRVA